VARNRQRNRTGRPSSRPARPFPAEGGDAAKPPIEDEPAVVFADDGDESGDVSAASAAFGTGAEPAAERQPSGNRVFSFLRASWAELQRVQWPDRQQVAQATGVVLGFVVITGIFLGVADYVAGKIINAII
jgi:preprotein translocase subunit SecE